MRPAALRQLDENITLHGGHRERIRTRFTVLVNDCSYLGKSVNVSSTLGEKWQTSSSKTQVKGNVAQAFARGILISTK